MPRQYLQLSNFSGGLNTRFDARDIKDDELTLANNVQVYKSGQIFTVTPSADFAAALDREAGTSTSGYGLFLFKSDNDLGNAEKSIELLAVADVATSEIDVIEDPFDTISNRDVTTYVTDGEGGTAPIDLGSTGSGEYIYYYVDGALRVADANGGAANTVTWYGHVDRLGTIPGGAIDLWVEIDNNLAAPGGSNCTVEQTGSIRYGDDGEGFDVDITVETTDDDGLWEATTYEFAESFVYAGDQESLLTEYSGTVDLSTNNYFTNVLVGMVNAGGTLTDRVKGGRIYIRKKDSTDLWTLFLDIDLERGIRKDMGDTFIAWANPSSNNWNNTAAIEIKGPSIDTYESINGFSPDVGHLSFGEAAGLFYKTATVCNMRTFVAHVKYYTPTGSTETKLMPDRILYTPIGKYDTFPPNQFIDIGINDGEDFTVLESFGTKILAFKQSTLYIIDVTSPNDMEWFLESTHNGLGVDKPSAVVKTEFGICWARKTGIYAWSPSQGIVELSAKLDKNLAPMTGLTDPSIGYYPPDSQLLVVQNCGGSSDLLVYDFRTKSFTEHSTYTGAAITNLQNNQDNCIWLEGNSVKVYDSSQGTSAWAFTTKDFDFGNPAITKKIKKIIVSYSTSSGVSVTITYMKDGDTDATGTLASTWATAAKNGIVNIDASAIGTCSSLRLKVSAGSSSYKINDITVIYRTRMKAPSTAVNS